MDSFTKPLSEVCFDYAVFFNKQSHNWYLKVEYKQNKPVVFLLKSETVHKIVDKIEDNSEDYTAHYYDYMPIDLIQYVQVLISKPNIAYMTHYFTNLVVRLKSTEYNYDSSKDFTMETANVLEDFKSFLLQTAEFSQDEDDFNLYNQVTQDFDHYFYSQAKLPNDELIKVINKCLKILNQYNSQ